MVTKQSFIKGAMILLIAGIVNRILGFIPRITLPRIIGAEGVGIYQLSYPFLIVMLTLISGGIPLAIAKWISEAEALGDTKRVKQIFNTAMFLSVVAALTLTLCMLWFAPFIIKHIIPDERVYRSFLIMSPLLIIVGISSVYRGYFQGKQNMIPSALSQTIETIIRIIGSLIFAYLLLPYGLEWGAAGAMLGVVAGEIGGLCVMLISYRVTKQKTLLENDEFVTNAQEKSSSIINKILKLSIPVTGSRLVGSISYLLESIFTARSLVAAGLAIGVATAEYGALQGMIMPLILLPTALTYSLAVSLIPSLSEAAAQNNHNLIHKRLHQSMRIALVTGAPVVVIMFIFAEPICEILYAHPEYAPMLKMLAPIGLFIYFQAPLQAALQALGRPGTALMNTLIGAVIKIGLIIQLASNPLLGMQGVLIAITINTVIVTLLHSFSVNRYIGFRIKMMDLVKVVSAMFIMAASTHILMQYLPSSLLWLNLLLSCAAGICIYLLLMIAMKIVDRHDVIRIPVIGRWFT